VAADAPLLPSVLILVACTSFATVIALSAYCWGAMIYSAGGLTEPRVTQLLRAWSQGDEEALDQLAPLVERESHRLAHTYIWRERAGHALQTDELVNEAYLRLIDGQTVWHDRAHFFAVWGR
jgi:hypothetical protein